MSTHTKIDLICIAAILFAIVLTVLFMNARALGIMPVESADADGNLFTSNDLNAEWNISSAAKITLSDRGSTIAGNGAYVYDGDVYIVSAGYYVLSGGLTNGSVIIDADKNDKIWILLNGAALHCDDDAAIRIEQADKVFLTLADGTENMVSSGAQYDADILASGVDGVIYSRDDLTINGAGALFVNAEYRHGLVCNDNLAIAGGEITIRAVQDGIHANDSVRIRDAVISISAGDDGITVSNDDETAFLYVESGKLTITDCYEGLEAIDITIAGGTVYIVPTDDGINANGNGENSVIRILGGDITIINEVGRDADGLDSNRDIYVEGGRIFISVSDGGGNCAIDHGSENGGECVISGGTVIACGGSMMAESFDAGSEQGFLTYSTSAEAGTIVSLEDSAGRELLSEEIPCSFSHMVLSTPDLKVGDVCTVVVDGERVQMTVDNTSSSGFGTRGMFGGGGMRHEFPAQTGGRDLADGPGEEFPDGQGIEPPGGAGMELPNGQGIESPGEPGEEFPDGQGIEPPGGAGMELPNGQGIEPPDEPGEEFPDGQGMEPFDAAEFPGGEKRPDGEETAEVGVRPFIPDEGQVRGNGARAAWQEQSSIGHEEERSSSDDLIEVLVLLGISVFVLLGGIVTAVRIRH